MKKIEHAVILAAGRGMRMAPLSDVIPKPMAPFDGSTLIAKGIDLLRQHVTNVHITVGYKGAMLAKHVIEHNVSSVLNTEGKGNAWWIYNTLLKHVSGPVVVLTCDNVVEIDFELLLGDYEAIGAPPTMLIPVKPVPGLDGDFIFHENRRVLELSRTRTSDIYCSGIQLIDPKRINAITSPVESFDDVWKQLIASNALHISKVYPKKWTAIDTVRQLEENDRS